ncbi:DcrB-related protein [Pseudomonas capeferrum]|uniref:DcrB-related protein n=1 Tax=Pseudomonas TaxID=286 RepID=UPI00164689CA|nr:DcrB-related protein [Pseudomonas sp. SWRI77]MBC3483987.1 DcrB-related protein [Pseudomonas sp. SWRI77]
MAKYLTQDVILDLGGEVPQDMTLNMLRFHERNTTLVIARSPVAHNTTLDEALNDQLIILRKQSKKMTLTPATVTRLGSAEHPVDAREMTIQFMVGDKPNYQLQAACLVPGQQRMLVLNYSKAGPMSDDDIGHWRAIKQKFRFA